EATAVSPGGRISPDDMGLWKDEQIEPLRRITSFIKKQGASPGIQLAHAGRKASVSSPWKGGKFLRAAENGWRTQAPSPLPFRETDDIPEMMRVEDIAELRKNFTASAKRALEAGYEVI